MDRREDQLRNGDAGVVEEGRGGSDESGDAVGRQDQKDSHPVDCWQYRKQPAILAALKTLLVETIKATECELDRLKKQLDNSTGR